MEPSTYEVDGAVARVTLDQPDKRNALTVEMVDSLVDHLSTARADDAVRAVVLSHTGTTFCAGADLSVDRDRPGRFDLAALLALIEDLEKPVVARIGGACRGGGVGLAAACDLSVASTEADFAFSEVRLGVAPAVISVVCLAKMGRAEASELFLTGVRFDAARAVAAGLVNRVVEPARLDAEVATLVGLLLAGAPRALGAAKRLVAEVPGMARADAYEWTNDLSRRLFASEEAIAGMAAFRERRPPPWAPGANDQS